MKIIYEDVLKHSSEKYETVSGAVHNIRIAGFDYLSIRDKQPGIFFVIIAPVGTDYLNNCYPRKQIIDGVYAYVIALKDFTTGLGEMYGQEKIGFDFRENNSMFGLVHGAPHAIIIKMTEQKLIEAILEPTFKLKEGTRASSKPGTRSRTLSNIGDADGVFGRLIEKYNFPDKLSGLRARAKSSLFSKPKK